ncbi:MAG: single-stranded DNA-binding protein [Lentisphaerae bacterium]|nr:single-stranded DNA-binding protein [Lentisphaerota bacterium]
MNKVFLVGNLTADPEIRYTPSGTAVSDLRLAVNNKFKAASGEAKEDVCYIDIVVWDRQAETCAQYLGKGSPILVEGRLKLDTWEKDGQKQSRHRVVANRVQFLGSPKNASFSDTPADEPRPASREASPEPPGPVPSEKLEDDDNLPF